MYCRTVVPWSASTNVSISMQNLRASVNVFHNCAKYKCKLKNTRLVTQERVLTKKTTQELVHRRQPGDLILNTAQLRSSTVLLAFRQPGARYPTLTRPQVIEEAIKIRAELDLEAARKKLAAQQNQAARAARRTSKTPAPPTEDHALPTSGGSPTTPDSPLPVEDPNNDVSILSI